jgi:FecR protein
MSRRSACLAVAFLLASTVAWGQASSPKAADAAQANVAGVVVLSEGDAKVSSAGKPARSLKAGDTVSAGDRLTSGKGGEIHVQMQDTGFLVVRPNTQFEIVAYKADGGDDDTGVFRLISGGLRSITGWIGKFNRKDYVVKTATATIGIRGTDHETRYVPEGSPDGEPGTYDRVYAGETVIQTPDGDTTVSPDHAGFQSSRAKGKPRLLADIPGFFRPGPHEAEINAKHAAIQQDIDRRREERRKAIREKFAALQQAHAKTVSLAQDNRAAAKQAQQDSAEHRKEMKARRDALLQEIKDAEALRADIVQKRKDLQDALKTGQVTQHDVHTRRVELKQKNEQLAKSWESIKQHRKELQDASDSQVDEQYNAALARAKALHDQQLDAREKRNDLQEERESAAKEVGTMQQQENKRYREELKADKQQGTTPPPAQ